MNILIIHNSYKYPGGEETYIQSLKRLLESNGDKVYIYVKDNRRINTLGEKIRVGLGLFWNRDIELELDSVIKNFKPDIAQFQNVFPSISLSAYWCCKNNNIPIVQRVSNYRFVCPKSSLFRNGKICTVCMNKSFFYPSIQYRCYNNSFISSLIFALSFFFHKHIIKSFSTVDMFIFPSLFTKNLISKYFPINVTHTTHIPTFTDIPVTKINIGKEGRYFIYAGRLSEEKGLLKLLSIFNTDEFKNINLYIVGNGPLKHEVKKACLTNKNMIYKGALDRKKLSSLLINSVGLILPAIWYDIQPNIVLETLSLGRPVIAPNTQVFTELIQHKLSGLLYKTDVDLKIYITAIWNNVIVLDSRNIRNSLLNKNPETHYIKLISLYRKLKNKRTA